MFGAVPPPEYNVLRDEVAEELGIRSLVVRAFAGETVQTPVVWYDPKEIKHIQANNVNRVAISCTFFPLFDKGSVTHVAIAYKDLTAERTAHEAAEIERDRLQLITQASELLTSSLELDCSLDAFTQLVVSQCADFCAVYVAEPDGFKLRACAHRDTSQSHALFESLQAADTRGLSIGYSDGTLAGETELVSMVSPSALTRFFETDAEFDSVKVLAPRSWISIPLYAHASITGAVLFLYDNHSEASSLYSEGDLVLTKELARRTALALENAKLYRDAKQAVTVREDFLAMASHELRTPLTPMLIQLESIERHVPRLAANADAELWLSDRVRRLRKLYMRLDRFVTELLDVTRIAGGRLQVELTTVDLVEVTQSVVHEFSESGQAERAGCPINIHGTTPLYGLWDRMRLEQVVTNLLSNAIKYSPGKPIDVSLRKHGNTGVLQVQDQGMGVPLEDHERIFQRFERAASSHHYGGLGLGLFIARQLVEAMGGQIGIRSQEEHGACFFVELPLAAESRISGKI